MDLYKEILLKILENQKLLVTFPELHIDAAEIVEVECYRALEKIKTILENEDYNDKECLMQIEEIICVFESLGSNGGNRHDFG